MSQTFSIKAMVHTFHAQLDEEELKLKQGPRRTTVATSKLRHLYVEAEGPMHLLWLSYEAENGKLKRVSMAGDAGDPGLGDLVEALVSAYPKIDIRAMPQKEALKLLGASSRGARLALGLAIVVVIMTLLSVVGSYLSSAFE